MNEKLTITLAVLAGLAFTAVPAAAADISCNGSIGAISTNDNLNVPSGKTCRLDGTLVGGNVTVRSNARLYAQNIFVGGNLTGQAPDEVELTGSTVAGDLEVDGLGSITLPPLLGLLLDHKSNCLLVDLTSIGGDLIVDDASADKHGYSGNASCLQVTQNYIGGVALFQDNSAVSYFYESPVVFLIAANDVGDDLIFQGNSVASTIADNFTGDDLNFLCNSKHGEVLANLVNGDLNYQNESPLPTIEDNTVFGATNAVACE